MERLRTHIQSKNILYGLAIANISIWILIIIPNLYFKGLTNALISLKSHSYCLIICSCLFCSINSIICFLMYLVTYFYLGNPLASERRFVFSNFIKDNPPLQLCIIVLGETNRSSIEALIWSIILTYLACCKGFCIILKCRLQDNKLKNLEEFNKAITTLAFLFVFITIILFKELGLWMMLMINFEVFFIIKECMQVYYQLNNNKAILGTTELGLQILDTILKIFQWLHLAFSHGNLFSANPVEFLLIIKLQGYCYSFATQAKQFIKYRSSIHRFTKQYPELSPSEVEHLEDEKCCIC